MLLCIIGNLHDSTSLKMSVSELYLLIMHIFVLKCGMAKFDFLCAFYGREGRQDEMFVKRNLSFWSYIK